MVEWTITTVCKTVGRQAYLGSNPSLSTMTSGKRLLAKVAPYVRMAQGISNPYRMAILYLLAHEPMWPEDISRHLPIAQNLVAHHLKAMVGAGWLKKRRVGGHVMYSLQKKIFREFPRLITDTPFGKETLAPSDKE